VAIMAEHRRADGPRREAAGIDGEGVEGADPGIAAGEEHLAEYQAGDDAIEEEVVPLDGGADGGGDHGAAKLGAVLRLCDGHGSPPRDILREDTEPAQNKPSRRDQREA